MNIEKAKQEFSKYVENYDFSNERIKRKFEHSFRVMKEAGELANNLNLSEKEIELANIIGLLHDIGRFEQIRIYSTFKDHKSIDHGDLGVEILKKDHYLRKYIDEEEYDDIIYKSIKNHNKFKIEDGLNEKELIFAKLIRDADKLDIFYEGSEIFWNTEDERKEVEESEISPEILKAFNNKELINIKNIKTPADEVISFIAFLYDINFDYSREKIEKQEYINKVLNKFNYEWPIGDVSFLA